MQAASRASLETVEQTFDEFAAGSDAQTLDTLGDELSQVTAALSAEPVLRKHLSEPSAPAEQKQRLAEQVFGNKVNEATMRLLRAVVGARWSRIGDLLTAVEHFARSAVLTNVERAESVDEVSDELFRFSRVLGAQGRLNALLSDTATPVEGRIRLLDDVVGRKVSAPSRALLVQAVRVPGGRSVETVVAQVADLVAARRGQSVAHVTAAVPLSDEQADRLARVLSEIYHRNIALQIDVDPEVLGGLLVRIGDEVIDGSVASKLIRANQGLPS